MAESSSISQPGHIAGYRVQAELSPGRTWLADGEGRRVMLKLLESDCLLGGELHPMIHDRLSRVRELAHAGVANLLGVEADGEQAYLVWEYVEGTPLSEAVSSFDDRRRWAVARELVSHVETLHALGIVHGALHARNAIVTPTGKVKLTHVSPLLYNDEAVDVEAAHALLQEIGFDCGGVAGESLRQLAACVGSAADTTSPAREEPAAARHDRRGALIAAALVAAAGAGIAWGVWSWANRISDDDDGAAPLAPLAPGATVGREVGS